MDRDPFSRAANSSDHLSGPSMTITSNIGGKHSGGSAQMGSVRLLSMLLNYKCGYLNF